MVKNFNLNFDKFRKFVNLTFPFVDKRKLSKLYNNFGFPRLSVTEDNTLRLMFDSRDFAYSYGSLVREAVGGREFKQALRLGQLDGVFVAYEGDATAEAGKSGGALGWITGIADALTKLGGTAAKLGDTYKGTNSAISEAERLKAEAALAVAQYKSNLWLILGIGGAVAVLVVLIILLKR